MIEAVYAVVIIAFASLGVLALFDHLVRGTELREAVAELRRQVERAAERIAETRSELEDLRFDTDTMEDERVALEQQTRCMLDLEERFQAARAAALAGDKTAGGHR